jgi:DNA-binding Xre family transcriptional regulator
MSLDYEWRLRVLMAEQGMFKAAELSPRLAEHGIKLSDSQVWRLVTGRPERLNLRVLVVLCEILDCEPGELVRASEAEIAPAKPAASSASIAADLEPKRARLRKPAAGT